MSLPTDSKARKNVPIVRGVLDYFPLAIAAVAELSFKATEQHHPGTEMHWDRAKSSDHADCIARHLIERGTVDSDGVRHSVKVAWRALALAQTEIEAGQACPEQPLDYPREIPDIESVTSKVARESGHEERCPCHACSYWRRALCGQWE